MTQHSDKPMTNQPMTDSTELTDPQDILHDVLTDIWNQASEPMWVVTDFLIEGCTPEQVQALIERARKALASLPPA